MPRKCRNSWKKDSEVAPVQEKHLPFSRTAAGLWVQSFGNLWSKICAEKLGFCHKCLFSRSDFLGQTSLCIQYLQYLQCLFTRFFRQWAGVSGVTACSRWPAALPRVYCSCRCWAVRRCLAATEASWCLVAAWAVLPFLVHTSFPEKLRITLKSSQSLVPFGTLQIIPENTYWVFMMC